MSNAPRDENNVPTLLATLNTNGKTIVTVKASPTSHGLCISDGTAGTNLGPTNAPKDDNFVSALVATSTDGKTPIVVYGDSNGRLLIKST